jgi:anti-sigma factor RsiW
MTTPTQKSSAALEHELAWHDRLQDWLDGDLGATETAALQAHLADCAACRARAEELRELDRNLVSALPPLALDDAFDARIFAQLDAIDESKRAATRHRMEQELQQNLQALARSWRRSVLVIVSGVVAGVALALGLASWLSDASLMHTLIAQSAAEFGPGNSAQVQVIAMTLLGAGVGGVIARWLATVVE